MDDNRISETSTSYAKVRLVHTVTDLSSSPLTLSVNGSTVASNVAYGTASDYASLASTSAGYLQVWSPSASIYASTSTNVLPLVSGGTYTMFMLGTSSTVSWRGGTAPASSTSARRRGTARAWPTPASATSATCPGCARR